MKIGTPDINISNRKQQYTIYMIYRIRKKLKICFFFPFFVVLHLSTTLKVTVCVIFVLSRMRWLNNFRNTGQDRWLMSNIKEIIFYTYISKIYQFTITFVKLLKGLPLSMQFGIIGKITSLFAQLRTFLNRLNKSSTFHSHSS